MLNEANLYTQVGESVGPTSGNVAPVREPGGASPVVALQGVHKRFNDIYALRNISITISPGEVFGLLGPTGSGKSTLVKLLLGFLQPDEGTVSLFGSGDVAAAKARIGYLPENPRYHPNFTGRDYLLFHARLSGLTRAAARSAVETAIEGVGLGPVAKRRIKFYERETLLRLGLAVATISVTGNEPGLLVLDEPSGSSSRAMQLLVRDLILDLKRKGTTVLIASHRITEIERTSTSVGILRGGLLMAQAAVENNPRIIIVAAPREGGVESYPRLLAHLQNLHPFVTVSGSGDGTAPIVVSLPSGPHIMNAAGIKASALRALVDASWDVISVYVERKDLESIYMRTAPPRPHDSGAIGPMTTGPLPNVTAPLGARQAGSGNAQTGPLPGLAQELSGRSTHPLHNGDAGGEGAVMRNGYEPIEGRSLRREGVS
ncbi:MAG: ABC transporter ATP-binding protein [Chloroflexota bacterium]